jgi:hypothetical protein
MGVTKQRADEYCIELRLSGGAVSEKSAAFDRLGSTTMQSCRQCVEDIYGQLAALLLALIMATIDVRPLAVV